jgi:hypothetical protein
MTVGFVAASVIGAGASIYSANKASKSQGKAIDAQTYAAELQADIAQQQVDLAQEQWDYQKNTYLPKSMDMAEKAFATSEKVANQQLQDSQFYKGLAMDATTQAKKSWKFQDQYMALTDDYMSGEMGNREADMAGADVQQAGAMQRGIMQRDLQRRGVNSSSGAGLALQQDASTAQAGAGAAAQTMARRMARDKAEQMVGIAAGSGQAGFGTGLTAGQLATGTGTAAAGNAGAGNGILNGINQGVNQGYQGVNSAFNGAGNNAQGAGNSGFGLGRTYGGSPFADAISGMFTGGVKSGGFNGISSGSLVGNAMNSFNFGTSGNNYNGSSTNPSAANYESAADGMDWSDIRLKDNVRLVGRSPRGYNWYAWTWKHNGEPSSGVIAQEVQKMDPDAVKTDEESGFLMVDYTRV